MIAFIYVSSEAQAEIEIIIGQNHRLELPDLQSALSEASKILQQGRRALFFCFVLVFAEHQAAELLMRYICICLRSYLLG